MKRPNLDDDLDPNSVDPHTPVGAPGSHVTAALRDVRKDAARKKGPGPSPLHGSKYAYMTDAEVDAKLDEDEPHAP